jgi:hypothetical protein
LVHDKQSSQLLFCWELTDNSLRDRGEPNSPSPVFRNDNSLSLAAPAKINVRDLEPIFKRQGEASPVRVMPANHQRTINLVAQFV